MIEWMIANAEERAAEAASFRIPTREVREAIKPGSFVKLIFRFNKLPNGCEAERMWVKVTGFSEGHYHGTLENTPALIEDLLPGTVIHFGPEHVIDVDKA